MRLFNARRSFAFMVVLTMGCVLNGCVSAPDAVPDVTDVMEGQTEIATESANVASASLEVSEQAEALAAALVDNQQLSALAAAHAASTKALAKNAQGLNAAVSKANKAIVQYVKDTEHAVRGKAEALVNAEKYKGQRNTLFFAALALVLLLVGPKLVKLFL